MKTKLDALIHEKTQCITEIYKFIISEDIHHDPFTQHRNQILKKNIPKQKDILHIPFLQHFQE